MLRQAFTVGGATIALAVAAIVVGPSRASAMCSGDCNNDGEVVISELLMGVNISLGRVETSACSNFDVRQDDKVTVDELVLGARSALDGCPVDLQAKTFRSVQQIFTQSCAFSSCHSAIARKGGLVLSSEEVSYANLVGVDPQYPDALAAGLVRVDSGHPENSFLLRKLRAMGPGDSMPQGSAPLSEDIIGVIEAWIARGAHETLEECAALGAEAKFAGRVSHAGEVETVCNTDPIDPGDFVWKPEDPLPVPAPGEGIQLYVPKRPVDPGTEWETCYAFRPDWRAAGQAVGLPTNGTPTISRQEYRMHDGSHHLLVYSYFGEHTDWEWPEGFFECSAGNCRNPGICSDGTCSSGKVGKSCTGNDDCSECPPDGGKILPIGGTQVAGTRYQVNYPEGVGIPVLNPDSVIIANLHYTNPFQPAQDIYAEAWLNFYFHKRGEFKVILDGLFAIGYSNLFVEPYETRAMSEIWVPHGIITGRDDANLFNLFGHMHKRATLFTVDLVSGGSCTVSGALCARDDDCACRPADRKCVPGQTCTIGPNFEDTTIYSTTDWDNAPVIDYPSPYLHVAKEAGLRWTCVHRNGIKGDPNFPPKRCHEGCRACGWDAASQTCVFTRGVRLGFDQAPRIYQPGDPMPLVFGELADDDMCNLFGYFIPGSSIDRLP